MKHIGVCFMYDRLCWRRGGFLILGIVKDTHTICLYECLSTVINTVLSVQVYYYNKKNITTIRMDYFNHFNHSLWHYFALNRCKRMQIDANKRK